MRAWRMVSCQLGANFDYIRVWYNGWVLTSDTNVDSLDEWIRPEFLSNRFWTRRRVATWAT